jgi:Flp pilus assembly protein TadD
MPTNSVAETVRRGDSRRDGLIYAIVFLAGVIPYLNSLSFGFAYDDNYQIVGNPYLRSFHYLKQILTTPVWSFKYVKVATNYYRPLMSLEYLLLYQAYGTLAYVYHLASVVQHAAAVVLLFAVTRRLFNSTRIAFLAALLFALHPIHTESVAWVAAVPDLQLALFLLLAFWFFLDFDESARRTWQTSMLMSGAFFLALVSKEPAIAFPLIATFYEYACRPDRDRRSWTQKLTRCAPLWVLTGCDLAARVVFIGGLVPKLQRPTLTWGRTILSSFSLFNDYMNKLVWPVRPALFDSFYPSVSPLDPAVLGGAAWIVGLALLSWYLWRHNRVLVFAILWMVATIAPALNARWMPTNVFAERYLYVPSIGFCWLAASGIIALWDTGLVRRSMAVRALAVATAIGLALLLAGRIVVRNRDWRDDLSLFQAAVTRNPDNADHRADLGFAYWAIHNRPAAIREWNTALRLNPSNVWALDNMGMAYVNQKQYAESLPLLRRAVELKPAFTDAHLNLAEALAGLGKNSESELEFQKVVSGSPLDWNARNRFADYLENAGRLDDAQIQFQASLSAVINVEALDGLGDIAISRDQADLAERYFKQSANLDSYDSHAHFRLAIIYGKTGRSAQAIHEYQMGEQMDVGTDPIRHEAKTVIDLLQKK